MTLKKTGYLTLTYEPTSSYLLSFDTGKDSGDAGISQIFERSNEFPVPVEGPPAIARYVSDEKGTETPLDEDIAEIDIQTGLPGSAYKFNNKEISGYKLKEIIGEPTGIIGEVGGAENIIFYIYEAEDAVVPIDGAPVTVKYQDEEGNDIAESIPLEGKIGLPYESEAISINGWTLKTKPENASGTFTDKPQEVTYVYERAEAGVVTVKYQDEKGNDIAEATPLDGKVGLPYESETIGIKGWTLKETPENASGTFTEETQEVLYIYKKNDSPTDPTDPTDPTESSTPKPSEQPNELLPQTGEQNLAWLPGLGIIILIGVAGYTIYKRRK